MPSFNLSLHEKRKYTFFFLACVLLCTILCLGFQSSTLLKTRQNLGYIEDIQRSLNSNLSNIAQYSSVCVSLDQWNEILTNLHDVDDNLQDKLMMDVFSLVLLCIVVALTVIIYVMLRKVCE